MRFLITFPSTMRGGAEEYALVIAGALAPNEVHAAFPHTPGTQSLINDFNKIGATCHDARIGNAATFLGRRPWFLVPVIEALSMRALVRSIQPDAALAVQPSPRAAPGVRAAMHLCRVPAAVCFQLTPPTFPALSPLARAFYRRLQRHERWIAVSHHARDWLARSFDANREGIRVILNGVPPHPGTPGERFENRKSIREAFAIDNDAPLFLTIARLGHQKGHRALVNAIPGILASEPAARFVWVGDGPLRGDLERRVAALHLDDAVLLTGHRDDVHRFFDAADYFLFPTRYEGRPFALAEAMAAALPVVASAVGGVIEMIQEGETGLLVPPQDPAALTDAALELLADPARARGLGEAAQAAAAQWTREAMTAQTLALLEEAAGISP